MADDGKADKLTQGELLVLPDHIAEGQTWQNKRNRNRICEVVAVGLTTDQGEPAVRLKNTRRRIYTRVAVRNLLEFWRLARAGE